MLPVGRFVRFQQRESALNAILSMNGKMLLGRRLHVELSRDTAYSHTVNQELHEMSKA